MVSTNGINNYKVSPIKASGSEIPLLLTFSVEQTRIHEMMKDFFGTYAQKANNDQTDDDSDN